VHGNTLLATQQPDGQNRHSKVGITACQSRPTLLLESNDNLCCTVLFDITTNKDVAV
jgi:hypothetical protein